MLDEMILVNVSKFAIFLEYENLCQHRPTRAFIGGKIAGNDKKKLCTYRVMGFHIQKIWQILNYFATSFHQA